MAKYIILLVAWYIFYLPYYCIPQHGLVIENCIMNLTLVISGPKQEVQAPSVQAQSVQAEIIGTE